MNNERRAIIAKARGMLEEAKGLLEPVRDAEQEAFDNMPENMQSGEKGEKTEANASALVEVVEGLEEFVAKLEEASE